MCVNNLSKVALDSAADGIEPAISSRNSQVQRPNHYATEPHYGLNCTHIEMKFKQNSFKQLW